MLPEVFWFPQHVVSEVRQFLFYELRWRSPSAGCAVEINLRNKKNIIISSTCFRVYRSRGLMKGKEINSLLWTVCLAKGWYLHADTDTKKKDKVWFFCLAKSAVHAPEIYNIIFAWCACICHIITLLIS